MKRRHLIILFASLALAGALLWILLRPAKPEPIYRGKTLTQWLQNYNVRNRDRLGEPPAWADADLAILNMGTNAYPFLLDRMRAYDAPWKLKIIAFEQKKDIDILPDSFKHADDRRRAGIIALGRLAGRPMLFPAPVSLPPKLSQAQADQLVPGLIDIFLHGRALEARAYAVNLLEAIGPPAKAAVPALIIAATNRADTAFRGISIRALCEITGHRPGTGGIYITQSTNVILPATNAHPAEAQTVSAALTPGLLKDLGSANRGEFETAIYALARLPPDPKCTDAVVTALAALLATPIGTNAQHVPPALENFGAAARPAVPALLQFIKTSTERFGGIRAAIDAIEYIDPETAKLYETQLNSARSGSGFK